MSTPRIEIQLPYYYDPQNGLLYNSASGGKAVRTQFFSDEQTQALHKQVKAIEDKQNQAPNDERSVATDPE